MTQSEVLKLLSKKREFMSVKEMAKELRQGEGSIRNNLGCLIRQKLVYSKKILSINGWWVTRYKII